MAHIVFADRTGAYDGRDLELRPLGATEASVIRCARGLARRGHRVEVYSNCHREIGDQGVVWRPLAGSARPRTCDAFVAVQQVDLLDFVEQPAERIIWVLWGANQLRHYKKIGRMWRFRPKPILMSRAQAADYWPVLPRRAEAELIHLPIPDDVRAVAPLTEPPPPRAIFASNPQRNLKSLVEIWLGRIAPRVPGARLDVYGVHNLDPADDPWKVWAGELLPAGVPEKARASVIVHPSAPRAALLAAMRDARAMLYLGHKCEAFCMSLAEAQALGTPAVIAPIAALAERVVDGVTGVHAASAEAFAEASVRILTDDALWRRQHAAALERQQGLTVEAYVERFEAAILARPPRRAVPPDRSAEAWRRAERRRLIAARMALQGEDRVRAARALEAALEAAFPPGAHGVVAGYWPVRGEFDVRPYLERCVAAGANAALPVVAQRAAPLRFRAWFPGASMSPGAWDVMHPADGEEVVPRLLLVPLVGFDRVGHRLGYGGGYFDRTLAALPAGVLAVGLGFELGRLASIAPAAHDRPMDAIVTEAGLVFDRRAAL